MLEASCLGTIDSMTFVLSLTNWFLKFLLIVCVCWSNFQHHERYERLLRRAKTEDLSEVSGIGCLYQSGTDKFGRPVVVFIGKWFNFNEINLDKVYRSDIHLIVTRLMQFNVDLWPSTGSVVLDLVARTSSQRRLHYPVLPHTYRGL